MRLSLVAVLLLGCERIGPEADAPRLVSPETPEVDAMRSSTAMHELMPPPAFAPIGPDLGGVTHEEKGWFLSLTAENRHLVRQICRARRHDPCAGMLPPPREDEIPEDQPVRDLLAQLADPSNTHVDEFCFQLNGHEGCVTPLVVAFDGQPVELLPAGQPPARFAFQPGRPMTSAWPTAATPWIALDRDRDGKITTGAELFGDSTAGDERSPTGFRDGFEALAQLDDNHDGVIDRHDRAFAALVLWRDDGDRVSQPHELRSLSAEVDSISLAHDGVRGSAERAGRTIDVIDLYLPASQ
jgi:hypothetical protein